ncbi:unnamed protein product [Lactuca saligna]|uniref:Uncharacterized protein n=1 Tax=Lactuca saligna TaxID=75948 RepID=A0AA35ZFJ4_LACSI|nr:unnamed protein product [Lactuca saligna]
MNALVTDSGANHLLFSFYLKHMKLQYETWSERKITEGKDTGPIETDSFPNAKFKVARGSSSQVCEFTLVDIPCINRYDWTMLYNVFAKIDAKIVVVLRRKLGVLPKDNPDGFKMMKLGKIHKNGWCVAFQLKEQNDVDYQKICFFLADNHLYTTSYLEYILEIINRYKGNSKGDKNCFLDMIQWYIPVRKVLLIIIPKSFSSAEANLVLKYSHLNRRKMGDC